MQLILAAIGKPFIPSWAELRPFAPDLILIGAIIAVLLTPFFTARRTNWPTAVVSLLGLLLALVALVAVDPELIGTHFRGILVFDHFAVLWKGMLLLFSIGIVLMWFTTTGQTMHEGDGPEFFTLLLGATLGMSLMASTSNLLMIFMAVELASLPSYVLAGFRKTHRVGAEASLKYVLFGAATSAVMVYGLSMLYGLYGTLQVEELAALMVQTPGGAALLTVSVVTLVVGIGFKISAVPFHFWCPDVFEGASIDVSAFLSVASKGAALALLLRVLMLIADAAGYQASVPGLSLISIAVFIGILGAITATVGNAAALIQTNIKRLLAYSSIAHAGYMLCALSLLVSHGTPITREGGWNLAAQTVLLYLAVYLFMNLGAFTVAGLVYRQTGREDLSAFAGLGRRSPVLAFLMTGLMVSLIGLPPLAGFVAKVNVLWALIINGGWWWALVVVIGVNTIVSLYYYLRVVKVMYFDASDEPAFFGNPLGVLVSGVCVVVLVAMLVGYGPLFDLTQRYARIHGVSGEAPAAPAAMVTQD